MSALAVKPETPAVDDESFDSIVNDLSKNVVNHFRSTGLPEKSLIEFVYAIDAIQEMCVTPDFVFDRVLTTSDIIKGGWPVVWDFVTRAKMEKVASNYGVAVSQKLIDDIDNFFNEGYLSAIYNMVKTSPDQKLMFVLDAKWISVRINQLTAHPEFGMLHYVDMTNHHSVQIPFHLGRILNA